MKTRNSVGVEECMKRWTVDYMHELPYCIAQVYRIQLNFSTDNIPMYNNIFNKNMVDQQAAI